MTRLCMRLGAGRLLLSLRSFGGILQSAEHRLWRAGDVITLVPVSRVLLLSEVFVMEIARGKLFDVRQGI